MPRSSSQPPEPFRRITRWLLVVVWAGVIFAASSRPNLRVANDDLLDFVLRKSAHLFVFFVLCILLVRALRGHGLERLASSAGAWLATLAYAASDEWHQTFVAGRVGHPRDVAIDVAGATVAVLVLARHSRRIPHQEQHP